jgi:hypothetical protein
MMGKFEEAIQAVIAAHNMDVEGVHVTVVMCGKCGRETVDGDCYGCEVDRLTVLVERLQGELKTLYREKLDALRAIHRVKA